MALWQLLFGNYRTVDTSFYQAFQKLQQKFVLDPIYDIIPETDGERYIWRYKFQLYIYARSYWAPVTDEDKRKGIKFHWFFASYKPELLPILLDIYDSIVKLDTLPIQDKEFSEIYRYLTMANMFQYYQMYRERQVNLEYERNQSYSNGRGSIYRFFTTPYYVDQHNRFLKAIDDTKEAIEKNKSLAKAFESKPHAKTALYWAGIDEYRNWVYRTLPATQDPRSLCQSRELKRYAKYYNEYLTWSQHPRSSFAGFSKHRKRQYAIMVESNRDIAYYAAKYLCGEKFGGYSYWERFVLIRTDPKDLRESLRWDMEHMAGVTGKKIIAWEDNLSIEENNLSNKQTPENNLSKEGITDER
jgi:hypothetical protein